MHKELQEFGLTDREIEVYLALLHLGSSEVQEVARRAGTYRTYTYEILKSLKEKGLVSYVIKSGIKHFEAAPPERLVTILREKEDKIQSILPELRSIYKSVGEKPSLEIYEGVEGLKTILDDLLKTPGEIIVYGSTKKQLDTLRYYFPNFIKRRIKKRIFIRVLAEYSPESSDIHKRDAQECREMRFLPESCNIPTATYVYGTKVAMISLEKDIIGVVIENGAISETQRMVFELLWASAQKR